MNPNAQQNLDPKLKEAYDRVMGRQINPQPAAPAQSLTPAQPQPQQQTPASSGPQPIISINTSGTSAKPQRVEKVKGKGNIPAVVWIVLGLLFFGGYTFIWLKVFKIL